MSTPPDAKSEALRQQGVLHPHPQDVSDPLFRSAGFFDARDLVQVKYEMLRRVRVEGLSVTAAAAAFGLSRPVFYQVQAAYQGRGLPGLIPQRPGPRRAHKLSEEVLDAVRQHQAHVPTAEVAALCGLVKQAFGRTVHPRSLERALARRRQKGGYTVPPASTSGRSATRSPGRNAMKTCVGTS
jgi:transposase